VHGLQAVANIGQGATEKHRHRICHVSLGGLFVKLRGHDPSLTAVTGIRGGRDAAIPVAAPNGLDRGGRTAGGAGGDETRLEWGEETRVGRGEAEARGLEEGGETEDAERGGEGHGSGRVGAEKVGVVEMVERGFHRVAVGTI